MKTWILAMVFMAGFAMNAQPGERRMNEQRPEKEHREPFTAAQRAEIRSKKLVLKLDLTDKQQKEIQKLLLTRETEKEQLMALHKANRDAAKKLTGDERFTMMSKRLDAEIAMKKEMKKILSVEQFAKYEQLRNEQHKKMRKGPHNFKKHNRR